MARFNPRTGEWEGLEPPRLSTTASTSTSSYRGSSSDYSDLTSAFPQRNRSAFRRFDDTIINIGNAIARFADATRDILRNVFTILLIAAGVIGLILLALSGHWIIAIILGLLFGSLFAGFSAVVAVIGAWIIFLPLALLRYLFYNSWTLIIGGLLVLAAIISPYINPSQNTYDDSNNYTEIVDDYSTGDWRYCTASSLVLRSGPSTSSNACGSLVRGERVKVIEADAGNGFSKVDVLGHEFYVASRYLSTNEPQ